MRIKDITNYLEELAPLQYQESYDNSGLLVGDAEREVSAAVITLDCTEDVVDEAVKLGANLIIAHHPIVFAGLKRFNGSNYIERTVIKAIENKVAIYAIHTNLDAVTNGVNAKIGSLLGLKSLKILQEKQGLTDVGAGMMGELTQPMDEMEFLNHVKTALKIPMLRYTPLKGKRVKTIAFCGGSGSFLLPTALQKQADVFISSDFKYHQFFDAENQLVIADIGHYEAEICTKDLIYEILSEKFSTFTLHFSKIITNPVNYL